MRYVAFVYVSVSYAHALIYESLDQETSFLVRNTLVRTNRRAIVMMFVCLSWTGVHCEHTFINVLGTLTPKHVHLVPAVFFQFHLEERSGMDVQTRGDISRTVEDRG